MMTIKKISYYLFAGLLLITWLSCHKCEDDIKPQTGEFEYFIFGHFYGKCGGEGCIEIFRIDADQLQEDTTDVYPGSQSAFNGQYIQLSNEKFEQVKDITQYFPEELYDETDNYIGQPDAGDWGGIYVEISYVDDEERSGFWLLDQNSYNMPDVYNVFVARINEKIVLINQ